MVSGNTVYNFLVLIIFILNIFLNLKNIMDNEEDIKVDSNLKIEMDELKWLEKDKVSSHEKTIDGGQNVQQKDNDNNNFTSLQNYEDKNKKQVFLSEENFDSYKSNQREQNCDLTKFDSILNQRIEKLNEFNKFQKDQCDKSKNNIESKNISSMVKSESHCAIKMARKFKQLKPNTNLNTPPSNWSYGNSKWENFVQQASFPCDRFFTSFHMANFFLDFTGDIDVVSESENIKKLLKIPFSKANISMMVHRIGNTLMLDNFDIHQYLLRQQENLWKNWLKKFYYETVREAVPLLVERKNKGQDQIQNRNMFSKFLYYSSMADLSPTPDACSQLSNVESNNQDSLNKHPINSPNFNHQRTVVWNFEDIRMLIGTDLPIFGGGTHPCVSLKLRDMKKPINVLTGLDYWLDNLMCNVPELAMCYHDNGIVQSYELLKTDDIPNNPDCKFSPTVIKDVAQNILSFLKSNATKEGHTYWLFKAYDGEIIKLYDLTTLCHEAADFELSNNLSGKESASNPFAAPVGVLLYRVASNLRLKDRHKCIGNGKKAAAIKKLLTNSLALLKSETNVKDVISAHYILADVYICDHIEEESENSESSESDLDDCFNSNSEEDEKDGEDVVSRASSYIEVESLQKKKSKKESSKKSPMPMIKDDRKNCFQALQHIFKAMEIIEEYHTNSANSSSQKNIFEEQAKCNPDEVIPLHYQPLGTESYESAVFPYYIPNDPLELNPFMEGTFYKSSNNSDSKPEFTMEKKLNWVLNCRLPLLRKAAIVYTKLAKVEANSEKYGTVLQCLDKAIKCYGALKTLYKNNEEPEASFLTSLIVGIGDVYLNVARFPDKIEEHLNQFFMESKEINDEKFFECLDNLDSCVDPLFTLNYSRVPEVNFKNSICYYEKAKDIYSQVSMQDQDKADAIIKRLANAYNEFSTYYKSKLVEESSTFRDLNSLLNNSNVRQSELYYNNSLKMFEYLNEPLNMALVNANICHLNRLCADIYRQIITTQLQNYSLEFSIIERKCFKKSEAGYLKALKLLEFSSKEIYLVEALSWDLSTVYFTVGQLLQDCPPISTMAQQLIESEIIETMQKALIQLNKLTGTSRQVSSQYRSALIHHRLGSLFHNAYRSESDDKRKRKSRLNATKHYDEACRLFVCLESGLELIRVLLERVSFSSSLLLNQTSSFSKIRTLKQSLKHLIDCNFPIFNVISMLKESYKKENTLISEKSKTNKDILIDDKNSNILNLKNEKNVEICKNDCDDLNENIPKTNKYITSNLANKINNENSLKDDESNSKITNTGKDKTGLIDHIPMNQENNNKSIDNQEKINSVYVDYKEDTLIQEVIKLVILVQSKLCQTLQSLLKHFKCIKETEEFEKYKMMYQKSFFTSSIVEIISKCDNKDIPETLIVQCQLLKESIDSISDLYSMAELTTNE